MAVALELGTYPAGHGGSIMLQDLTTASFEAHLGTPFRVHFGGESPMEVVLHEVKPHEPHPGTRTQPFSVYFFQEAPRPILPQSIYPMEHEAMGRFEIFIVPVGPHPQRKGMLYEAVFN
jgi:uncharacterized protein DUF6916